MLRHDQEPENDAEALLDTAQAAPVSAPPTTATVPPSADGAQENQATPAGPGWGAVARRYGSRAGTAAILPALMRGGGALVQGMMGEDSWGTVAMNTGLQMLLGGTSAAVGSVVGTAANDLGASPALAGLAEAGTSALVDVGGGMAIDAARQRLAPSPAPAVTPESPSRSEYPMAAQPGAQEHFDEVREVVKDRFPEGGEVRRLSDRMGEDRAAYSLAHPEASNQQAIHAMQVNDSARQVDAVYGGQVSPDQILPMAATSFPFFMDSLLNEDKRPENASQWGDALGAAAGGFLSILQDPGAKTY